MGWEMRRSTSTSTARVIAPPRPVVTMTGDPQPRSGPSLTAYMTEANPTPASTKPARSNRPGAGSRCSRRKTAPKMMATIPMGTLT